MNLVRLAFGSALGLAFVSTMSAADSTNDAELKTTVDDRIEAWKETPEEKRFDQIGWAPDIRTAKRLAAEHQRPVFVFTMDGRVNLGRC
jgi:hypothetical protein